MPGNERSRGEHAAPGRRWLAFSVVAFVCSSSLLGCNCSCFGEKVPNPDLAAGISKTDLKTVQTNLETAYLTLGSAEPDCRRAAKALLIASTTVESWKGYDNREFKENKRNQIAALVNKQRQKCPATATTPQPGRTTGTTTSTAPPRTTPTTDTHTTDTPPQAPPTSTEETPPTSTEETPPTSTEETPPTSTQETPDGGVAPDPSVP